MPGMLSRAHRSRVRRCSARGSSGIGISICSVTGLPRTRRARRRTGPAIERSSDVRDNAGDPRRPVPIPRRRERRRIRSIHTSIRREIRSRIGSGRWCQGGNDARLLAIRRRVRLLIQPFPTSVVGAREAGEPGLGRRVGKSASQSIRPHAGVRPRFLQPIRYGRFDAVRGPYFTA